MDDADCRASRLEARVRELTQQPDPRTGMPWVIGESAEWKRVLNQAVLVASTDTNVLLLGESGTGKEVAARFVHRASSRKGKPFVALNCAALPEQLLEAELFGYERGAYTGATQSKAGLIEQAAGGTLFLDEVGEMSPAVQAKFLRVLQEREFQRLGGTRLQRADIRVVAATNRDLRRGIAAGQFREDLFYRLNVFPINLPPLRNRREDIMMLAGAFVSEISRRLDAVPAGISFDARRALHEYHWPGNVRELRNALERASILCDGGLITAEHLGLTAGAASCEQAMTFSPTVPELPVREATERVTLDAVERGMIDRALTNARFNKSKAAKALGLTRHQLYIRMRKHALQ
jgi:transcriptional regulator with GAF, ATPase, and Fis domain